MWSPFLPCCMLQQYMSFLTGRDNCKYYGYLRQYSVVKCLEGKTVYVCIDGKSRVSDHQYSESFRSIKLCEFGHWRGTLSTAAARPHQKKPVEVFWAYHTRRPQARRRTLWLYLSAGLGMTQSPFRWAGRDGHGQRWSRWGNLGFCA